MMSKLTFTDLTRAAQTVRGLLAKGAGHKYIKRIPVGQTESGRIKYRYIYKETHTVGGKHLLDEAHLKVGTKLMLETGDGKQVHAHITAVNGDKVTIEYDDGARKGETKTLTKQKLLSEFDEAHGLGQKIDAAREQAQEDVETARRSKASEKVIARLEARVERLRREIKRNVPSALQKKILRDHSVSVEKIEWHRKRVGTRKHSMRSPVHMMKERIDRLTGEGVDEAVTSYNNMLERAAADNQDVLTAIEAYEDLITVSFADPDNLNRMMQTQADNLKHLVETYGVTPDMTGAEALKAANARYKLREFERDVEKRTGHRPAAEPQLTIDFMCSSIKSVETIREQLAETRLNSEVAQRARAAIQEHVEKACADFSYGDMKYSEGEYHENHKRDSRKRTPKQRAVMDGVSHVLAHVEDVFERAYPERKAHKTKVSVTKDGRAFAEMVEGNKSTISLAGHSAKTAAHELAHTLEGNFDVLQPYQQRIQEAATLTNLTRTGIKEVDLYGDRSEYALEDKYASEYTGKVYSHGSTELVTTGVEEFFTYSTLEYDHAARKYVDSDPAEGQMKSIANFAITDPHHYLVTYGILKGYAK